MPSASLTGTEAFTTAQQTLQNSWESGQNEVKMQFESDQAKIEEGLEKINKAKEQYSWIK